MQRVDVNILRCGSRLQIKELYHRNRLAFINFGSSYGLDETDLIDIYQEAFIVLRSYALNGKLFKVKSSLKTYLFGIGKFMIYDRLKELNRTIKFNPQLHIADDIQEIPAYFEESELTPEQKRLRIQFMALGKKCQELLTLFYSRGLSIDEIVEFSDYSSNSVVRSQKSRCLKNLRDLIHPQK